MRGNRRRDSHFWTPARRPLIVSVDNARSATILLVARSPGGRFQYAGRGAKSSVDFITIGPSELASTHRGEPRVRTRARRARTRDAHAGRQREGRSASRGRALQSTHQRPLQYLGGSQRGGPSRPYARTAHSSLSPHGERRELAGQLAAKGIAPQNCMQRAWLEAARGPPYSSLISSLRRFAGPGTETLRARPSRSSQVRAPYHTGC